MRNILLTVLTFLICAAHAKHNETLRCRLIDGWIEEPLSGAKITSDNYQTETDSSGHFSISVLDTNHRIHCEKPGYFPVSVSIAELFEKKIITMQPILKTDPITVIAGKASLSEMDISSSITKIEASRYSFQQDLGEVLAQKGAAFIKNYGGQEAVKSLSMRGMGAEQTLILLDGVPLNSSQTGSVDLDHYFLESVSEIEVYRGGFSTLFGSGAIGGMVNLSFKPPEKQGLRVLLEGGAYGLKKLFGNISLRTNKVSHSLNYMRNYSNNSYSFILEGNKGERINSDFNKTGFNYLAHYTPSANKALLIHYIYYNDRHGVPRAVTTYDAYQGQARMYEQEWLLRMNYTQNFSKKINGISQVYIRRDWMTYQDPDVSIRSDHFNENAGVMFKTTMALSPIWQLRLGVEGSASRIQSTDSGNHNRKRSSLYVLTTWLFWQNENFIANLNLAGRGEYYSDIGTVFLPRTGINFILKNWRFFLSAGYNFRIPSLNELYWEPGGDPNLRPEKSSAFETGIDYNWNGLINGEVTVSLYHLNLSEMIRWSPTQSGIWRPQNLDKVSSNGVELRVSFDLMEEHLRGQFNYKYGLSTLDETTSKGAEIEGNRLPYLPSTELKASLHARHVDARIGVEADYMSFRYTTLANLRDQILSSVTVYNLFADYEIGWQIFTIIIYGRLNNIFKKEVQYINNYPLPVQPWKIGVQFELRDDFF
jgi:outer membrane cobalamin receptor